MAPSRRRGSQRSFPWGVLLLALVMLAVGIGVGYHLRSPGMLPSREAIPPRKPQRAERPRETPTPEPRGPKVALVIDDLGQAPPELVTRLCAQPIPLTVAVLPFLNHTHRSVELAREGGKEVILHLPMEPLGYPGPSKDPGPGAIFAAMGEREVRDRVQAAIREVAGRSGVNNHMGSRVTPDRRRMTWILEEVKARGLYFLDSRTEKDSVAFDVARELGLRTARRQVFLDDDRRPEAIEQQWSRALEIARREGEVVVIGHLVPETLGVLERQIPRARSQVAFVTAGSLATLVK